MDEGQVIPLHGDSGPLRRLAARRRPSPTPRDADVVALVPPRPPAVHTAVPARTRQTRVDDALTFLRRRLQGDYEVDDFGFDADLATNVVLPLLSPLYERWFRVEVNGVENIPADGGALLVANHAGGLWALDAAMTSMAVHRETGRFLRPLAAGLVFRTPGLGPLARKTGSTVACTADADRLLAAGELVGVWPEGFSGIGKPFRERYKLQRFGRGGFVQAAVRAGVPIVPVSIIGSEEIHPVLGNVKTLARVFDLPYFPLTPTFPWLGPLGLVPLPEQVVPRVRPPDRDRGVRRRGPGRRDHGVRAHRPGARDDPELAVPTADPAPLDLALTRMPRRGQCRGRATTRTRASERAADRARPTTGAGGRRCRRRARPAATPPVAAPTPSAVGMPMRAALRPVRKSRISHPCRRASALSAASGFTATARPTSDSSGRSLIESEYAEQRARSRPSRPASARTASALASPCTTSPTRRPV